MEIKKYTACYSVFAEDEQEAWGKIDDVVNYAMIEESTVSNTFALLEEEPTEEEIETFKLDKLMSGTESEPEAT